MIGTTLSNYRILEKIGEGGQGSVYKAIDSKLGRTVVIKVLPHELTARAANLKRFEREARLASTIDHPNICTIFDLNEEDGVHFIVMQHVEGKNVRQLVAGKPLDLRSALSITIQVADALASAHAQGIIHRDVKAGNVMVTPEGKVKVLDFGLAKLVDESFARSEGIHHTELTEVGVPYGTATYAAPEQARGDRVDLRADIFSNGVLLYELLTGTWPFHGKTSIDVRHAVIHDTPKPISAFRRDVVSTRLQEILDRAMAKEPRARYQKAAELRDELRAVLLDVSEGADRIVAIDDLSTIAPRHHTDGTTFGRAVDWVRKRFGREGDSASAISSTAPLSTRDVHETPVTSFGDSDRKSVAILPFKNLSEDASANFYEFSLADAVITELAQLKSLVVRPSSLIARYQGKNDDPREVGRELHVGAVLTAGLLKAGDRLRVTAQLLDVVTGSILWSNRIDVAATDVITVQDTIAQQIVEGLRIELSQDEKGQLAQRATENAEAYDEFLRGRDALARFINRTLAREDLATAIEHFSRAIELDPDFALAHSGLGLCYANRVFKAFGDKDDYDRAEDELEIALDLDPNLVEARIHMVYIFLARGEKQKARDEVARLRRLAPNDPAVHRVAAVIYRLGGEYDRTLRSYRRAVQLNPDEQVVAAYNGARVYMYQGRYDEAMREHDKASAIEPDHPLARAFRARCLYYMGRIAEARRILEDVLSKDPQMEGIRPILATCLSAQGEHEAALAQLTDRARKIAAADHDIAYWVASAFALENLRDEAFEWLERAINLGNENRPWFENDRNWVQLRNDPRFPELMNRLGPKSN